MQIVRQELSTVPKSECSKHLQRQKLRMRSRGTNQHCIAKHKRPVQTDATLLASNTQHCWAQHLASACMEPQCWHLLALVAYSLKPVKLLGPCKRTQYCWPKTPNNTQQCCDLLRPFAWTLRRHEVFPQRSLLPRWTQ